MVWLKRWCRMMNDAAMAMAAAAQDDEGECQDAFVYCGVFQWLLAMQPTEPAITYGVSGRWSASQSSYSLVLLVQLVEVNYGCW